MAAFNKYQKGVEALVEGINAGSDVWKVALSNRTPVVASDTNLASAVEISAGNGYTAGGNTAATVSSTETSGTYKLVLTSPLPLHIVCNFSLNSDNFTVSVTDYLFRCGKLSKHCSKRLGLLLV